MVLSESKLAHFFIYNLLENDFILLSKIFKSCLCGENIMFYEKNYKNSNFFVYLLLQKHISYGIISILKGEIKL